MPQRRGSRVVYGRCSMTSPLSVAADALVADADSHDDDAIRSMAREMVTAYGCTYSAAKGAVQRAIKRSNGEIGAWGGKRQPAGGRPTKQEYTPPQWDGSEEDEWLGQEVSE